MDTSLLITLLVIFGVTLVGALLRALQRDRSLKDLHGYHVAIQWADGRVMWGKLAMFSTGMELSYMEDVVTDRYDTKTSYLVYKDEYPQVEAVLRFISDLDDDQRKSRDKSRDRAFHPGPLAYASRRLRNYVNTAAGSLSEALNLMLGQSRLVSSGYVMSSGQTQIKGLTKDVLGYVGASYDAMIESMVGARVVAEVLEGETQFEYNGVLRDYSSGFVQVMDVEFAQIVRLELCDSDEDGSEHRSVAWCGLEVRCDDQLVIVKNMTERDAVLVQTKIDGRVLEGDQTTDVLLRQGTEYRLALPARPMGLTLDIKTVRRVDMVLPRRTTRIRHRAERYRASDALDLRLRLNALLSSARDETEQKALAARNVQVSEGDLRISRALATRHDLDTAEDGTAIARKKSGEKANRPPASRGPAF